MFGEQSSKLLRALSRLLWCELPSLSFGLPSLGTGGEEAVAGSRRKVAAGKKKEPKRSGEDDCRLCQSDEMLRLVLEAAELGTWRWEVGEPEKPLIWDTRCKTLFGLPPEAAVTYETWANAVHPEDFADAQSILARALDPSNSADGLVCKYRIVRPDGRVLWLMATGRANFEPDATQPAGRRCLRVLGTVGDVTETEVADRRRIEREERGRYFLALEERLRSACAARDAVSAACEALGRELGATFAGVGELQADGIDTVVESAWSAAGDPDPLLGRHRFMGAKRIGDLLAGGAVTVNDVLADPRFAADEGAQAAYRAFGTRSSINVPLVRDGRPRAVLFVANDAPRAWTETEVALARETLERAWQAVERARAEAELRLTTERFELALKGSPVVLFCQDLDLRYTWIYNPAFGQEPSEVIGRFDSDIFERAEDAAATEAIKREAIRTGTPTRGEVLIHSEGVDRYYDLLVDPMVDAAGHIKGVRCASIDITERKREQQHIRLLMREVNHRSKNMLTLVQAVARQTAAKKTDDFLGRFDERLRALAASQDLVVKNEWRGADLDELLLSQLSHFKDLIGSRIELKGPPQFISASASQTIGMAIHELGTNAGKYGALSNGNGRIDVLWRLERDGEGHDVFVMDWRESDGPPVSPPTHRGFGSTLISRIVEVSLNAEVELDYPVSGLFWRMTCGAEEILDSIDESS